MTSHGLPPLAMTAPEFVSDPHAVAAAHRPVSPAEYDPDWQGWLVLRHADVSAMLRDPSFKKDPAVALDGPYTQVLSLGEPSMLFMDDPDHGRLRGLVSQAFSKRATEAAGPRIQAIVCELLDAIDPDHGPVDLVSALAVPFPITVIAEILGVDPSHRADFKRWSDDGALSFDPMLAPEVAERVATSGEELRAYLAEAIAARRAAPGEDLISTIVAVHDADGTQLGDEEAISAIALLLLAGNMTTTDLIGNGLVALLQHPDQLEMLQADPSLIDNAVEEMLRYDPPVVLTDRIATADVSLDGCPIGKGQWIWPVLTSANRDPAVHVDPDRFDIRREHIRHVSFGGGPTCAWARPSLAWRPGSRSVRSSPVSRESGWPIHPPRRTTSSCPASVASPISTSSCPDRRSANGTTERQVETAPTTGAPRCAPMRPGGVTPNDPVEPSA